MVKRKKKTEKWIEIKDYINEDILKRENEIKRNVLKRENEIRMTFLFFFLAFICNLFLIVYSIFEFDIESFVLGTIGASLTLFISSSIYYDKIKVKKDQIKIIYKNGTN